MNSNFNISGDVPAPRVALWGAPHLCSTHRHKHAGPAPLPWGSHSRFYREERSLLKTILQKTGFKGLCQLPQVHCGPLQLLSKTRWHIMSLSPGREAGAAFKAGTDQYQKQNQKCVSNGMGSPLIQTPTEHRTSCSKQVWKEDRSHCYSICTIAAQS